MVGIKHMASWNITYVLQENHAQICDNLRKISWKKINLETRMHNATAYFAINKKKIIWKGYKLKV